MTLKGLTYLLSFFSIGILNAQCAYERIPNFYTDITGSVKIIETKDHCSLIALDVGADTVTGHVGHQDILLIKNDSCGNKLWSKTYSYSSVSSDFFGDILELSDGSLIILTSAENAGIGGLYNLVIWKLSPTGNVIWKKFNGKGIDASWGISLIYNPNRNSFIVSGSIERAYPGKALSNRPYILEVDSNGDLFQEKDIIINQDTLSSTAKYLRIKQFYMMEDSSFLGLMNGDGSDSVYAIRLDRDLILKSITTPLSDRFKSISSFGTYYNKSKKCLAVFFTGRLRATLNSGLWLAEINGLDSVVKYSELPEMPPAISISNIVTGLKNSGYILGYDLLLVDSNLDTLKHTYFKENVSIQGIFQMNNGSIVCAGRKGFSNGTYKPYIVQTDKHGVFLSIDSPLAPIPREDRLKIYPNPGNDKLTVESLIPYNQIQLWNIAGIKVMQEDYHSGKIVIDISTIPSGLYILNVLDTSGNIFSEKVSIQH